MSSYTGDRSDEMMESKFAWQAGAKIDIPINASIYFSPEILIVSRGANLAEEFITDQMNDLFVYTYHTRMDTTIDYEGSIDYLYLEIPLWIQFNIIHGLFIEAGPTVSVVLSSEMNLKAMYDGQSESAVRKITDDTFDLGIAAGIGYQVDHHLGFDLRAERGFLEIGPSSELYNIALSFNVFYYL